MSRLVPNVSIVMAAVVAGALFGGFVANADDDIPTPTPTDTVVVSPEPTDPGLTGGAAPAPDGSPSPDPVTPSAGPLTPTTSTTHGNSFSSPEILTGRWPIVTFDSTSATTQSGEPRKVGTSHYLRRTMWAKWKAPQSGYVTFGVYAGYGDTGLNVYRGSSLGSLTRVATNDNQRDPVTSAQTDTIAPSLGAQILGMHVTKGKTYYLQVGTSVPLSSTPNDDPAAAGFSSLSIITVRSDYTATNDFLVNATTLKLGAGMAVSMTAYLNGSTMERWEPTGNPVEPEAKRVGSVWYKWTAPQDGAANLGICTWEERPTIAIFRNWGEFPGTGAGDLSAMEFEFESNNGNCAGLNGALSDFPAHEGVTYFMQVSRTAPIYGNAGQDDYPQEYGTLTLTVDFHEPYIDKISPTSGSHSGGNTVTITGDGFMGGGTPVVKFGSKTATLIGTPTEFQIKVKAPSHSIGTVNVTVTSGGETSPPKKYTYK